MTQTREGAIKTASKKLNITPDEYIENLNKGLKWCTKKKHWASLEMFNIDKNRKDGLSAVCKNCRSVSGTWSPKKGRELSPEHRQKIGNTHRGKKLSEKQIDDLKKINSGNKYRLGKKHSLDTRKQISQTKRDRRSATRGKDHHSFKDGKLAERRGERFSTQYKQWRYDVFMRDNFACQKCGDGRGGNLRAHHIKHFSEYPELRFEISNGITLCASCHKLEH